MDETTTPPPLNFYSILSSNRANRDDIVRGVLAPPAGADQTRRILSQAQLLKLAPNLNKHFVKFISKAEIFEELEKLTKPDRTNWLTFFDVNKQTEFFLVPSDDKMYKGGGLQKVEYAISVSNLEKWDILPPNEKDPVTNQTIKYTKKCYCIFRICYDITTRPSAWGHYDFRLWNDLHIFLKDNKLSNGIFSIIKINESKKRNRKKISYGR